MNTKTSIANLLTVLDQLLFAASATTQEAREALITAADQNLAVGTLLPVERQCEDALAMLRVIFSLHRHGRDSRLGAVQ